MIETKILSTSVIYSNKIQSQQICQIKTPMTTKSMIFSDLPTL